MKRLVLAPLAVGILVILNGCGGGGSPAQSGAIQSGSGRASLAIQWPARTRLIPEAANSITIVIDQGTTEVAHQTVGRPASGSTSNVTFALLPVGTLSASATAFPSSDGTGTPQATATVPLTIQNNQNTAFSITMTSTIDHLNLTAGQTTVTVGSTLPLTVTAIDAAGAVVLLTPSKLTWSSSATAFATVNSAGLVSGIAAGPTTITVKDTESNHTATLGLNVQAAATSLLYDGWDYPVGSLIAGLDGGTGNWGGAWNQFGQGNTDSIIQAGSLSFGSLATSGNSVLTTGENPVGHARKFAVPNTFGTTGTVMYVSFLVKPVDPLNVGSPDSYFSLVFGTISIGMNGSSTNYGMNSPFGTTDLSNVSAVTGQTAFLVTRFTFVNGTDRADLWVNPTPGQPLPATPDATKTDTDTGIPVDFNIGSSIRTVFDEIRFGTTWESVSPVH